MYYKHLIAIISLNKLYSHILNIHIFPFLLIERKIIFGVDN